MLTEPYAEIPSKAREINRVITSLREELEAVDYYNQRAEASSDRTVKELMIHNRDEEIEHASMLIEWLRRNMPEFDKELKQYMFTTESLIEVESGDAGGDGEESSPSLGIGSLR